MRADASQVVEMLRAAGEPTRLRVLALLAREELAVAELVQILGHSQPRVSRHLKLLAEAGLVERFPDGAWVFYRLCGAEPQRSLVHAILDRLPEDEGELREDLERLDAVREGRGREASAYFARNAAQWAEIRSLYVSEAAVEAAILAAAGPAPYGRLIDLGTGAGRMLTLLGTQARHAIGLDLSANPRLAAALATLDQIPAGPGIGLPEGANQPFGPTWAGLIDQSDRAAALRSCRAAAVMLLKRTLRNGSASVEHGLNHPAPASRLIPKQT